MGTYSYSEFVEMFGGEPEPGETYPDDPDAIREREQERRWEREADQAASAQPGKGERDA